MDYRLLPLILSILCIGVLIFKEISSEKSVLLKPHIMKEKDNSRNNKIEVKDEIDERSLEEKFLIRNQKIEKLFAGKLSRVRDVCDQYKNLTKMYKKEIFLNVYSLEPSMRLGLCRTAKHGSTTWAKEAIKI